MLRRTPLLGCLGCSLFALVFGTTDALAQEPSVAAIQEAALPPGTLPAWETQAERALRRIPRPQGAYTSPPPLPPPTGYRVAAEFEPLAAFLVTEGDWDSTWSNDVQMLIDMIVQGTVAEGAGAIVLTRGSVASYQNFLAGKGVDLSRVRVVRATAGLDAKWARDFGPISLYEGNVPGHLAFADLHYYDARDRDDAVAGQLAQALGIARYGLEGNDHSPADSAKLYMEGGNFMTDGQGTCILSNDIPADNAKNGNQQADTQPEVEAILATYLNCQQIIWLTPMPNNSTGHVDMYAKLLTPTDMLMIDFPSQAGANGQADAIVEANVEIMQAATNLQGQPFTVHRVVVPSLSSSSWIYRTYTNSTLVNHVALVPTYASSYDDAALQVYRDVLGADYTVTGIDSSLIVAQGGAVHCTTMQIASACGDGKAQTMLFESCDGADLANATCLSLGLGDGQLACTADCSFDTTGCSGAPEPDAGVDAEPPQQEAGIDADVEQDSAQPQDDGAVVDSAVEAAQEAAPADKDGGVDAEVDGSPEPLPADVGETEGGGCSCRTTRSAGPGLGSLGVLALAGALGLARRRRELRRRRRDEDTQ